ncbi:MAG: aspartate aminotransferase family protein [Polyangiaceae bacterium]
MTGKSDAYEAHEPSDAVGSRPSNAQITSRFARSLFPSAVPYYAEPIALESGAGARVRDFDGKTYLDFFGGILTLGLGHAHDKVGAAARAQMDRLGHVSAMYPTLPIVELAERLIRLAPGRLERAFFCASGTEANETAVALAQAYTGRQEIIALRHSYAGRSLLTQSLGGHSTYRSVPSQVGAVRHAHAPYCYRCPFGLRYPSCELKCADDIEELIQTTTSGRVAAMIVEPILGVGGFITPPAGWLDRAVEIVRRYGGLFICDEIQTGFGRTGRMWGVDGEGALPDVMTMAKGIANGFPISAILATTAVAEAWHAGNVSTFGGNPVSCAAANATIDTIAEEHLVERSATSGRTLRDGLEGLKAKYSVIGDVRGRGLMQGLELVADEKSGDRAPAPQTTLRVFEETKRRGLLVGRGWLLGNVLRIAPPLIIDASDIAEALRILDESFAAVLNH